MKQRRPYKPEEDAVISTSQLTARAIAEQLGRSRMSVQSRKRKLVEYANGYRPNPKRAKFNQAEIFTIANWTGSMDDLVVKMGRGKLAILRYQSKLGLRTPKPSPNRFTPQEDHLIINDTTRSVKELAEHMNRTICVIYRRLSQLRKKGLHRKRRLNSFTDTETNMIASWDGSYMQLKQIARKISKPIKSIVTKFKSMQPKQD